MEGIFSCSLGSKFYLHLLLLTVSFNKKIFFAGVTCVAQSVEPWTLHFTSGPDLMGCGIEPHIGRLVEPA